MKFPNFFLLASVGLMLSSCSNEEAPSPRNSDSPDPSAAPPSELASADDSLSRDERTQSDYEGIRPVQIEIPAIDVRAEIEPVGTLANGQMGVPQDVDHVGWYEPGTLPGSRGSAVMAGHIDSLTGPAIFYELDKLEQGDDIIVTDADGTSITFTVSHTETYPRKKAPIQEVFGFSYGSRLNLITCTGEFNRKAKTHEERLVVYTEMKEGTGTD